MPCDWSYEQRLVSQGFSLIAGIDEAGRGPLAGPVVAAAVVLPIDWEVEGLTDSKKLSRTARELWFSKLQEDSSVRWGVGQASPAEIDGLNILRATHLAMRRAFEALGVPGPQTALIDGLPLREFPTHHEAVVKGDSKSVSIAAASVIAKVTRDRLMAQYALEFPQYAFDRHKGYPTRDHLARLRTYGPCAIHRQSFAPLAQLALFPLP